MIRIYGIKNCDTMKKAFAWCDANHISYEFHDYKKQGVPRDRLLHWCRSLGWQTLVNTKGPTWRKLAPEQQAITTQSQAVALMMEFSSVIRRPVVENDAGRSWSASTRPGSTVLSADLPMDAVHRFLLEDLDIRGALVQLGPSWTAMTAQRKYAPPVRELLGELAAVTALIGSNLKTPGRISFQLQGHGPVSMLVMDCNEKLQLRGMARSDLAPTPNPMSAASRTCSATAAWC
jgi:arsenate reductase